VGTLINAIVATGCTSVITVAGTDIAQPVKDTNARSGLGHERMNS